MQGMYDLSGPARRFRSALHRRVQPPEEVAAFRRVRQACGSSRSLAGLWRLPGGVQGIFKDDNDDNFS